MITPGELLTAILEIGTNEYKLSPKDVKGSQLIAIKEFARDIRHKAAELTMKSANKLHSDIMNIEP